MNYSIVGPVLIELSQRVGVKIELMGYFFSIISIGFIIGAFSSSIFIRFNIKNKIFKVFYLLLPFSVLLLAFSRNYSILLISAFFIGLSNGVIESNVTVILAEIHSAEQSKYLNISQAFFSFGAFAGPFLISALNKKGLNISTSFIIMSFLCILNFILLLFIEIPAASNLKPDKKNKISILKKSNAISTTLVIFIFLTMFFYVCFESGINSWIPTFLRLNKSFSIFFAGNAIALFWLTITIGRFLVGFISTKIRITHLLLIISILTAITFKLSTSFNNTVLITILLIFTGLLIAGIWPLIISLFIYFFPKSNNSIMPLIIMTGGIGSMLSPWIISLIYGKYNIVTGVNIIFIFSILIVFFIFVTLILENTKIEKNKSIKIF